MSVYYYKEPVCYYMVCEVPLSFNLFCFQFYNNKFNSVII